VKSRRSAATAPEEILLLVTQWNGEPSTNKGIEITGQQILRQRNYCGPIPIAIFGGHAVPRGDSAKAGDFRRAIDAQACIGERCSRCQGRPQTEGQLGWRGGEGWRRFHCSFVVQRQEGDCSYACVCCRRKKKRVASFRETGIALQGRTNFSA